MMAAILCAGLVEFPSDKELGVQLGDKYGGGFELSAWSDLPHGSGESFLDEYLSKPHLYHIWRHVSPSPSILLLAILIQLVTHLQCPLGNPFPGARDSQTFHIPVFLGMKRSGKPG